MFDRRGLATLEVADGDFGMRLLSLEMARGLNRHVLAVAMCARRAIDRDLVAGARALCHLGRPQSWRMLKNEDGVENWPRPADQ